MAPDAKLLAAQAQDMKARGRLGEAISLYRQAVAAAPSSAAAEHNLAAALGDAGRWAEAEAHIRNAFAKGGSAAESMLVLGRCLQSRGAFDEAERAYLDTLTRRPNFHDAHLDLAQLRWMRTADSSVALGDLDRAILQNPADLRLSLVRARVLEGAGLIGEAFSLVDSLAHVHPGDHAIAVTASGLAAEAGDADTALRHAERAIAIAPDDSYATVALATACLGAGEPARAEACAARLLARTPYDQLAIALRATAWRLLGDPRYHELYDYDAVIHTSYLEAPPGWSNLKAYVGDLRSALQHAHAMRSHPFGQSIRNGSQRPDILSLEDPAIAALPQALDRAILSYVERLGTGADPLRARNQGGYAFQGMWSIRMQAGGYHVNHVHPNGWISSACYVEAPDACTGQEGWIKFGEPGVRTAPALAAERAIAPAPGMIVMFPSYMWHGVIPYAAPGARMTFAFDLEPSGDRPVRRQADARPTPVQR